MSNPKVVKRQSGSSRNARRNRERRAYRERAELAENLLLAARAEINELCCDATDPEELEHTKRDTEQRRELRELGFRRGPRR